jgi:outer membrane receptor protein involved in Fe transport
VATLVAGGRYEKTDVDSTSNISIPQAVVWQDDNDFNITQSSAVQPFSEKSSYNYFLPSLDFSLDFNDQMKGRASASKTIARAPMGNLLCGANAKGPDRLGAGGRIHAWCRRFAESCAEAAGIQQHRSGV